MAENITGIILEKSLRGESGVLFKIFSAESGLKLLHKRVGAKKTSQLPDFFDEIFAECEKSKMGEMYFLKDFELQKSRTQIAVNYDAFLIACEIAKFALKNANYLEGFAQFYKTLSSSLDAINSGADATSVYIKFLYVFMRDEGYAIKEDFVASLTGDAFALLKKILTTPALELKKELAAASLLKQMQNWILENSSVLF